jgi:hypothetical protein
MLDTEEKLPMQKSIVATAEPVAKFVTGPLSGPLIATLFHAVLSRGLQSGNGTGAGVVAGINHLAFGAFILPLTYRKFTQYLFPEEEPRGSLIWALVLWAVSHSLVVPGLHMNNRATKVPALTSLLAYIGYGIVFGLSERKRKGQ